ncbi:PREDICTED: protein jagged-1-like [Priapulus caudatus]|uniref:Protein jagged-1-like n=1 Tax=Priapulus caudatus TaxID=37621 RepID=A0ABM1EJ89_PRICU|nr:PREDICTED: protein jagged-1-like [Priapulus caudatus]
MRGTADVVMVQENKQEKNFPNPCKNNPCSKLHSKMICINQPLTGDHVCVCPATLLKVNDTCKQQDEITPDLCSNQCINGGTCLLSNLGVQSCRCPSLFTGNRCQHNICADYCLNSGSCKASPASQSPAADPTPICSCPIEYKGKRCEVYKCSGYCVHGGCLLNSNGEPSCECVDGWTGEKCDQHIPSCENYCKNGGTCHLKSDGLPECMCTPNFLGDKCQHCNKLKCENEGICQYDPSAPYCICPQPYEGKRCQNSMCDRVNCTANGVCVAPSGVPKCKCNLGYAGKFCEQDLCTSYCHNGAPKVNNIITGLHCLCPAGFTGNRCGVTIAGLKGPVSGDSSQSQDWLLPVVVTVVIAAALVVIIVAVVCYRRRLRSKGFSHMRMTDNANVEISNPMYMRDYEDEQAGEALEESTLAFNEEKPTNFSNPMYDTMYNEGGKKARPSEETKGLLNSAPHGAGDTGSGGGGGGGDVPDLSFA